MKILTSKQVNDALNRIAANYLITVDALEKANLADEIDIRQFMDATEHLTDNSLELANIIGGTKGMLQLNSRIESYRRKLKKVSVDGKD